MRLIKKTVVAAVAVITLSSPFLASAVVKTSQISADKVAIRYNVSDLNSVAGREQLERQVRQTARMLCGVTSYTRSGSIKRFQQTNACYQEAVEGALQDIHGHALTAL